MTTARATPVRLGLRANLAQFTLLVAVNALVGGTIGQERTVLPLLAEREFGLTGYTASLTFIVAFGVTKAITNLFAGEVVVADLVALADQLGTVLVGAHDEDDRPVAFDEPAEPGAELGAQRVGQCFGDVPGGPGHDRPGVDEHRPGFDGG